MFSPKYIVKRAKSKENQNLRFRSWLKWHVSEKELDEAFRELHEEIGVLDNVHIAEMLTTVEPSEMERIAEALGITVEELKEKYLLHENDIDTFPAPCPMLQEDGTCRIQDVKPEECCAFPYTDRPDRMHSLYAVMEYAGMCPVVYEIVERLKLRYQFV